MVAELPDTFKLNGRYNKSQTAKILGISRTSLDKYISLGEIRADLNRRTNKLFFKGTAIVKFFNS